MTALLDGYLLTRREVQRWVHQPAPVVIALLFPVLQVLIFGYLFGGAFTVPNGSYLDYLMPGVYALAMMFGLESTLGAVTADLNRGVTDRFRAMPVRRTAILTARAAADMLNSCAGLAVLLGCGLLVGWRANQGIGPGLAAVALLLLLRFALVWLGIYLGLLVRRTELVTAVQILVWPLGFCSSAFVSPSTMPPWLGAIAEWNPLSATAAAARQLFGNPGWGALTWAGEHPLVLAGCWPVLLLLVFVPLAVRRYRRG
ncbi:ABC transporter permease [Sciscionella sediminilitoris]|uniref:ABC transporter permease n=1 Tax=Sciscionella sediminilitoris TaxID=1445613 RepID=UPI0004DEE0E1|nr:ABC transporter permease [Sciscionella sp. SE31]